MCSTASRGAFFACRTDAGACSDDTDQPTRARPFYRLRRTGPACYPSRVCSIRGEAIERIAEAIDQLANDAQGESPGTDLAARVADIWLMVTALDPELARRQRQYTASTTPADGAPSQ